MDTPLINPARVDFVTLRLFCAVAEAGSISKGAADCRLALSAASRRLADFEATVGTALLQRSSVGVSLTPAGHVALRHARQLSSAFQQFSREIIDHTQHAHGRVTLWANMSAMMEFLPEALAKFKSLHPDVYVDVREQTSGAVVRAVKDGSADIGVMSGSVSDDELQFCPFFRDELVLLCHVQHPLAGRRKIAFAESLDFEHIGLRQGSSLLELTTEAARQAGKSLTLRVQVSSFDAACQMIAANLGIGVLPLLACRSPIKMLGLRTLKLTDAWAIRQLFAATKSGAALAPVARLLYEHLTNMSEGRQGVAR
jgi:DNA-binding transcriptional LysR family regulator